MYVDDLGHLYRIRIFHESKWITYMTSIFDVLGKTCLGTLRRIKPNIDRLWIYRNKVKITVSFIRTHHRLM